MKFSQLRADRDYFTGKLSEIVRQLDFAGLAVIWIFRVGGPESTKVPDALIWPLLLLVLSLGFDLLHYVYGSLAWDYVFKGFDRKHTKENEEVRFSKWWSFGVRLFFWPKLALAVLAYGFLAVFIWNRL